MRAFLTWCLIVLLYLQDTARNFLCGSVADKKKYEIFMKVCYATTRWMTGVGYVP